MLGCIPDEDQRHNFQNCRALNSDLNKNLYDNIFENSDKQNKAISVFIIAKRYGPLRGPSSSCGGLLPRSRPFFCPLGKKRQFLYLIWPKLLVVTLVIFLKTQKKQQQKTQKISNKNLKSQGKSGKMSKLE